MALTDMITEFSERLWARGANADTFVRMSRTMDHSLDRIVVLGSVEKCGEAARLAAREMGLRVLAVNIPKGEIEVGR